MDGLTLRDVMTREFVGVNESDSIAGAVRLMREEDTDSAVVLRGGDPVGFVTAAGLLDIVLREDGLPELPVTDVMSDPPKSLRPEASLDDATAALERGDTDHVLVTTDEGVVGLVDVRELATTRREPTGQRSVPVTAESENGAQLVDRTEDSEYSTQSICEACSSLARDLSNVNGQLICVDCRGV